MIGESVLARPSLDSRTRGSSVFLGWLFWFSSLYWDGFLLVFWFSSLVKNQNLILSYSEIARSAASPVDAAFMLFKHLETVRTRWSISVLCRAIADLISSRLLLERKDVFQKSAQNTKNILVLRNIPIKVIWASVVCFCLRNDNREF